MNWQSDICYMCLDDFSHNKPRLFSYNCIHATCRECLFKKIDYVEQTSGKLFDTTKISCDYGYCKQPLLEEALCRNFQTHKINDQDALFIYSYSSDEIPEKDNLKIRDTLQQILIKAQGLKPTKPNFLSYKTG